MRYPRVYTPTPEQFLKDAEVAKLRKRQEDERRQRETERIFGPVLKPKRQK